MDPIIETKPPHDKSSLRSISGAYQYYAKFIPNVTKVTHPFFDLLSESEFKWTREYQKALQELKLKVRSEAFLKPFSPNLQLTNMTDPSRYGLGVDDCGRSFSSLYVAKTNEGETRIFTDSIGDNSCSMVGETVEKCYLQQAVYLKNRS